MPRQNFLSRDSFVPLNEMDTRAILTALPFYLNHIEYVSENKILENYRFLYHKNGKQPAAFFIDVSVGRLNEEFTRLGIHISYSNGQAFYEDAEPAIAMHDFEASVHALIKGDLPERQAAKPEKETTWTQQLIRFFWSLFSGRQQNQPASQ